MIHQYQNNGYNIVLDVNSGSIHVVDDLVYDIIDMYEEHDKGTIVDRLSKTYRGSQYNYLFEEGQDISESIS